MPNMLRKFGYDLGKKYITPDKQKLDALLPGH